MAIEFLSVESEDAVLSDNVVSPLASMRMDAKIFHCRWQWLAAKRACHVIDCHRPNLTAHGAEQPLMARARLQSTIPFQST